MGLFSVVETKVQEGERRQMVSRSSQERRGPAPNQLVQLPPLPHVVYLKVDGKQQTILQVEASQEEGEEE